jgi:hypothetical protein
LNVEDIEGIARDVSSTTSSARISLAHVNNTNQPLLNQQRIRFIKSRQIWGRKIDAVWRVETSLKQPQP